MNIARGGRLIWAGRAFVALAAAVLLIVFAPGLGVDLSIFKREWPAAGQDGAAAPNAAGAPVAPERAVSERGAAEKSGPNQAAAALATVQQQASGLAALLTPVAPAAPDGDGPSFDVVSVEPTGETVVAGRAAPG